MTGEMIFATIWGIGILINAIMILVYNKNYKRHHPDAELDSEGFLVAMLLCFGSFAIWVIMFLIWLFTKRK